MSETKINVREYRPVSLGWLGMLLLLVGTGGWIKFVSWAIYLNPANFHPPYGINPGMLLATSLISITGGTLLWLKTPIGEFIPRYFRNNVRGNTVYLCYLEGSQSLNCSVNILAEEGLLRNQVVCKFPLGGWLKNKPTIMKYEYGTLGKRKWGRVTNWGLSLYDVTWGNHFADCAGIRVYVRDYWGSRLRTTLGDALKQFPTDPETFLEFDGMLAGFPAAIEHVTQQEQMIANLVSLVESTITDIDRTRRFGKTVGGMQVKLSLDAGLSALLPERVRHYQDEPQAVS